MTSAASGAAGSSPDPPVGMIALDIDGTILDFDGKLTDRVRAAIHDVVTGGWAVVLATGRSTMATLPVLDRLGLIEGWAVCSNGAVTARLDPELPDGFEIADAVTFDPAPVLHLLREQLPAALYAVEDAGRGFLVTAPFPDDELAGEVTIADFAELQRRPTTRVTVRSPSHTSAEFLQIAEEIGLHGVSYAVGWSAWLDLSPKGVTKASALEQVRMRLRVPPSKTIAVGDWLNDLEMFAWAHRSVAMGQALPEVRAAADEVTAPVTEDGLADVLEPLARPEG